MGKLKIQKGLSDSAMFQGFEEEIEEPKTTKSKSSDLNEIDKEKDYYDKDLKDKLNEALLKLKVNLYEEGIVDYKFKVKCEGREIILKAVPLKKKK